MKIYKRKLAILLVICMVMTNMLSAFAAPITESVKIDDQQIEEVLTELDTEFDWEKASPPKAEYERATPSNAEYTDEEELENDTDEIIPEKATPSNAEYVLRFETVVDGVKITLTADPGVFPEGAELWAGKVDDTDTKDAIDKAIEEEKSEEEAEKNIASRFQFDIKMFLNGKEIQPDTSKGIVKISFTFEEKLNDCLDVNVYHVTGEDDDLTAEMLNAEVETDEEVNIEDDKILIDDSEDILSEEITEGIVVTTETYGFSYYVVEFTYTDLQYVLNGDSSIKLSDILAALGLTGTVTEAVVSNKELFTVIKDAEDDDWTVTALQAFSTEEWMKVTIDGHVYVITVTDALQEPVSYLYWDDTKKTLVDGLCTEYILIDVTTVEPDSGYVFENGKWYVVKGTVTFNKRIENSAVKDTPAHLILTDGHTLNVNGGIHNVNGHALVIYGQAEGNGCLNIPGASDDCAGIGGNKHEDGGGLIVNGGTVSVTGQDEGAGIGGGSERSFDYFIINGGTVNATGGYQGGAGIGGGKWGTGGNVTVNGGTVNAYGCEWAAGIGGGHAGPGGNVTINGGKIFAQGNSTCAIGNGYNTVHRPYPGEVYFGDIKPTKVTGSGYLLDAETLSAKHSDYNPVEVEYKKANYTVKHWKQKEVFKDDYELIGTETLPWFANNDTKAAAKEIPDYSASFTQAKIEEDGTTVIDIRYNVIYYTISFDMKGHGEPVKAISAVPETPVSEPASPSEEGYVFEGWYTDADCKNKYQFTTMPLYNLTLYAKWTAGPFERQDVSYVDENGNTATATCIIMPENQKNYAFTDGEWYAVTLDAVIENRIDTQASNENPAHLVLTDGHSLTANKGIECGAGKGLVIYGQSNGTGKLTAAVGDIAYSGIGSDGDITINGGTVIAVGGRRYWPTSMSWAGYAGIGGHVTINGGTVTATGGEPEGSGIGYGNDGSHIGTVTINGGIVTATGAKNAPGIGCGTGGGNVLTITINGGTVNAAGGTGADGIGPGLRGKADITVNGGEITATGATGKAGIGGNLSFGRIPSELKAGADKGSAEDVDIETYKESRDKYPYAYLRYSKAEYQVKHMLQKEICGDEYELKDTERLSGYVNSMTEAVARDIYSGYEPLLPIEQKTIAATGTVVEIRYNLIYHTVTFDANGHGTAPDPSKVISETAITAPKEPSAEGYIFGGWFTDNACTKPYDFKTPVTSDLTLYAKWTKRIYKKYTITWMLNDIKLLDTTEVLEGEMPVHENPAIEGYIFVGWKPTLAPASGNTKYTAYFKEREANKVAVTFNTDGGTFIDTQIIDRDSIPERPADPQKKGCAFEGWYREARFITPYEFDEQVNTDMTLHAKWKTVTRYYEITWQDWDKKELAITISEEGKLPKYPGTSNPSRSGYIFTGWAPEITRAHSDQTYTAAYRKKSNGGGGGSSTNKALTYSPNWYLDAYGIWRIRNSAGQTVVNAWLCDDYVSSNGRNVWYLLGADGAMITNSLVQDRTGNFYSLETEHNGYFGSLRYKDGYYNCSGQRVYLTFHQQHDGSFGAITNPEGIEKLKAIYGVKRYDIGNESAVYTKTF